MKKGIFVTFEGIDGSGKTTHIALLSKDLQKMGFSVLLTREPGGSRLAESIRKLLLNPSLESPPLSELLLYEAARADHVLNKIIPALNSGKIVLCDRFCDATLAYQGFARGIDTDFIKKLNFEASYGIEPDITIYMDLAEASAKINSKKAKKDFSKGDRIENENSLFFKKVRKAYLRIASENTERITVIKVGRTIALTSVEVIKATLEKIKKMPSSKNLCLLKK